MDYFNFASAIIPYVLLLYNIIPASDVHEFLHELLLQVLTEIASLHALHSSIYIITRIPIIVNIFSTIVINYFIFQSLQLLYGIPSVASSYLYIPYGSSSP